MAVVVEILSGPDRGKRIPLVDDLAHFGRGDDNTVVLSDAGIEEYQATISRRGENYELYTDLSSTLSVNGALAPAGQWVALSLHSRVFLGGGTEIRLCESADDSAAISTDTLAALPVARGVAASSPVAAAPRKPARKESKRQVAKLIPQSTVAEPVILGQDGKYPELALASTSAKPTTQRANRESNPALLFTVLAASFLSSAGLLLVDFEGGTPTASRDAAFARSQLAAYYGPDAQGADLYQKLLREASVEHSQGHYIEEQRLLKRVLSLLHAVDTAAPENLNGLTGRHTGKGKAGDIELRKLIEQILNAR